MSHFFMILEARAGMQKYFRWDSTSKSPYGIGLTMLESSALLLIWIQITKMGSDNLHICG